MVLRIAATGRNGGWRYPNPPPSQLGKQQSCLAGVNMLLQSRTLPHAVEFVEQRLADNDLKPACPPSLKDRQRGAPASNARIQMFVSTTIFA